MIDQQARSRIDYLLKSLRCSNREVCDIEDQVNTIVNSPSYNITEEDIQQWTTNSTAYNNTVGF